MKEINLIHLISNLIKEYENVYGMTRIEVKKMDNTFVITSVDQNWLNYLMVSRNSIVGKTPSDLFLIDDLEKKKLLAIYEEAWNGKELIDYQVFSTNKDIMVVYILKPILKNGKTEKLEGHCAFIDVKDFESRIIHF